MGRCTIVYGCTSRPSDVLDNQRRQPRMEQDFDRAVTPFSWSNPYAWPRKPLLAQNVVATSQPLAAQAGLQMLAAGGNAVDAILATAITLSLVEAASNGLGRREPPAGLLPRSSGPGESGTA